MTTKEIQKRKVTMPNSAENLSSTDAGLEHYLALDYPIELVRDEDAYVASHPDLPGCQSFGENPTDAVERLGAIRKLWIQAQLESGRPIPEPTNEEQYSGKFVLRIPKGLHRIADLKAKKQGVSLNAFLSTVLAGAIGYPEPTVGSLDQKEHLPWFSFARSAEVWCPREPETEVWTSQNLNRSGVRRQGHSIAFIGSVASQLATHHKIEYFTEPYEEFHRDPKKHFSRKAHSRV
jgi:predicted HicB family RNase H-like nuclease